MLLEFGQRKQALLSPRVAGRSVVPFMVLSMMPMMGVWGSDPVVVVPEYTRVARPGDLLPTTQQSSWLGDACTQVVRVVRNNLGKVCISAAAVVVACLLVKSLRSDEPQQTQTPAPQQQPAAVQNQAVLVRLDQLQQGQQSLVQQIAQLANIVQNIQSNTTLNQVNIIAQPGGSGVDTDAKFDEVNSRIDALSRDVRGVLQRLSAVERSVNDLSAQVFQTELKQGILAQRQDKLHEIQGLMDRKVDLLDARNRLPVIEGHDQ